MIHSEQSNYEIILGSKSPRRKELLEQLGIEFTTMEIDVDESYPEALEAKKVAKYLAEKKGTSAQSRLLNDQVLITADTVVVLDEKVLGKPGNEEEAFNMLKSLSGKNHEVITGVAITTVNGQRSFDDVTRVSFYAIDEEDIRFYIREFQPYDKAGSYGIQEWIGLTAVRSINGCFFNVIGLPVPKLWLNLDSILPQI
ncbi:MAG: Maf family nucleotide pyrophosphatase [Vicingaceae bacterium]